MSEIDNKRKASFEDQDLRKKPARNEQGGKGGKRKNGRVLIISLAALVLVGGIAILATQFLPPLIEEEPVVSAGPDLSIIRDRKRDDIDTVTLESNRGTLTFYTDPSDELYHLREYPTAELDQNTIDSMFYQAAGLKGQDLVEENPADLAIYGLDKPTTIMRVAFKNGETINLLVGDDLVVSSKSYVMLEGDPNVYTAYSSITSNFNKSAAAFMSLSLPTLTLEAINYASITTPEQELLIDQNTEPGGLTLAMWKMRSPWEVDCNSENMTAWLEKVAAISATDYAGSLDRDDPASFGLDQPSMRIVIKDTNDVTLDLTVGDTVDGYTYFHETGKSAVLRMEASKLAFADVKPIALVDRFVNIYMIDRINGYTLSIPGREDLEFTIERVRAKDEKGDPKNDLNGNPMYDETFFVDGKQIPDIVFKRFYQVIIGAQLDGFQEHAATSETPILSLTYHLTDDKGDKHVAYLPYDRDYHAIDIDGTRMFIIRKESIQRIFTRLEDVLSENYASFENT